MRKLTEWLKDLCLSESGASEVGEELEPIIAEMTVVDGDSPYDMALPPDQPNRSHSVLIHPVAHLETLTRGQRQLMKLFMNRYYRILCNCLSRIQKCSAEKKLKYLIETTLKNIFTETLRVSYDLKMIEYKRAK